jgi:hypothetical protein
MNTPTVVKKAPQVAVATLVAVGACSEIFHAGLEPNPHIEQTPEKPGYTLTVNAAASGNVAAQQVKNHFANLIVEVPGVVSHSVDMFVAARPTKI